MFTVSVATLLIVVFCGKVFSDEQYTNGFHCDSHGILYIGDDCGFLAQIKQDYASAQFLTCSDTSIVRVQADCDNTAKELSTAWIPAELGNASLSCADGKLQLSPIKDCSNLLNEINKLTFGITTTLTTSSTISSTKTSTRTTVTRVTVKNGAHSVTTPGIVVAIIMQLFALTFF
eukprot:m.326591 g.326591  ORF g.326591 m.326591 type:complete len:175 (+) comp16560_c0_seq4:147-671(+)